MPELSVIADYGDLCGEGPIWDVKAQRLYWTDITGQKFYSYGIGGAAAWTRSLLIEGELGVPPHACRSLGHLLPSLARALFRRPDSTPFDLLLAHLLGLAVGPWIYLYSRWRLGTGGRPLCPTRTSLRSA